MIARIALALALVPACSVDDGGGSASACLSTSNVDLCSGSNLCIGDACAAAFPHDYVITNVSATAPNLKQNGDPWDADGDGTPDIYVDFSVGGAIVATTAVNADSFNASFAGPFTVSLTDGANLDAKSSDKDDASSEVIYDCPADGVTAAFLRTRYVLCSGVGGVTINYTINPAP